MTTNTPAPAQEAAAHDLHTSEGARAYVAEFFATQIGRHDFKRYITNTLAADFACALAQHLSKLRAPVADIRHELNQLGMTAHTALHQDARDMRNIMEDLAERLLALAGGAALASAPEAGEAHPFASAGPLAGQFAEVMADNYDSLLVRIDAAPQASEAVRDAALEACRLVVERFGPTEHDYIFSKRMAIQKCRAALSAQPGAQKGCSCATCRPHRVEIRMILCDVCGDKRCPHAADHRNECVGTGAQNKEPKDA